VEGGGDRLVEQAFGCRDRGRGGYKRLIGEQVVRVFRFVIFFMMLAL